MFLAVQFTMFTGFGMIEFLYRAVVFYGIACCVALLYVLIVIRHCEACSGIAPLFRAGIKNTIQPGFSPMILFVWLKPVKLILSNPRPEGRGNSYKDL